MKKVILLSLFIIIVSIANAQTVENIQIEQDGDKLNIHYRIGGSTSEQLYFVTLTCSIDNGPEFEPKSVIGDVGGNIRGGKSFNTVVWDVFRDVDEIGSLEFFVKVDLISGEVTTQAISEEASLQTLNGEPIEEYSVTKSKDIGRKKFFGYGGGVIWQPLGVRFGTLGNWGGYGSVRYGGYDDVYYGSFLTTTAGVTKLFLMGDTFRLHGYAGMGLGDLFDTFEMEAGIIGVVGNRVNLNLGFSYNYYSPDLTIGIGLLF